MRSQRQPLVTAVAVLLPAVLLLLRPTPSSAQTVRVTPLARDGQVLVSFAMADGFSEDVRAAIRSGLPTSFSYDVELRRSAPLWFDQTLAVATVSAMAKYDNLTRKYQVTRMLDGRLESTPHMTDQEDIVRTLMTQFEKLPLFRTANLEANAEYYLRVRVRTRPRSAWFLWPWNRPLATGRAKFTYIP